MPWQELGVALGPLDGDTGEGQSSGHEEEAELHLCRTLSSTSTLPASLGLLNLQEKCKPHFPGLCSSPLFPFHQDDSQRLTAQQRFKEPLRAGTWS